MRYWLGCLLLLTSVVNAAENKHTMGGMLGTAWFHFEDALEEKQTDPMVGAFYDYRLHPHLAINVTFLEAEGEQCFVACSLIDGREAELKSLQASIKAFLPITQRLDVFARAGVARYNLEITGNDLVNDYQLLNRDEYGTDGVVGVGFQVRKSFLRIGAEWQYQRLGDDYTESLAVLVGATF